MPYRSVVVGTDGSQRAARAVDAAARLAAATGATLHVVSAFPPRPDAATAQAAAEAPDEVRWRVTAGAGAEEACAIASAAARAAGVATTRAHAEPGDPADVLLAVAEREGADVVVVGSKGMSTSSRFLLGSVPNKVSHHAGCDVLIVQTA